MDKNQKGPPGWNITDEEGPEITLGPEAMMPAQEVIKQAHMIMKILTREQKSEEIMRLEILLSTIDEKNNFNEYLKVIRKIQKLRDSL